MYGKTRFSVCYFCETKHGTAWHTHEIMEALTSIRGGGGVGWGAVGGGGVAPI